MTTALAEAFLRIRGQAIDMCRRKPEVSAAQLAREALAGAPVPVLRDMARGYLISEIESDRRARTRKIEKLSDYQMERRERIREQRKANAQRRKQEKAEEIATHGRLLTDEEKIDRSWDKIFQAMTDFQDHVRLKVTAELLASSFKLGDGTSVTWGQATVRQHQQREDMLLKDAGGTIETAARHKAARGMIEEAGVTCLAEIPREVAA